MGSIVDILDASASRYPDKIAVRYRDKAFTYSETRERVDRLARALYDLGVREHAHVALISHNSHVNLELLFAAARLGAVLEQYNPRLSKALLGETLKKSETKLVFVSERLFESKQELMAFTKRPLEVIFIDDRQVHDATGLSYERLLASSEPLEQQLAPTIDGGNAALLLYTSGTTAAPKGVLISHDAIRHQAHIDTAVTGIENASVQLCVLPLSHVTFLSAVEALAVGAELVILDVCKGSDIAQAITRYGVTHVSLIPLLLRVLVAQTESTKARFETLRLVLYGAEPISVSLLERAKASLRCAFVQGYGMTETTAAISMLLPADHASGEHLTTAGRPLPGVEIKIVGEDGAERPALDRGEVIVKTKALMLGYYQDPKRTAEVMRDGWYYTGDIGYLDTEGYLHLVARKNDMIISGGENVYPQEISTCVAEIEGVANAVAMGIPDEQWGEAVAVIVEKKDGCTLTETKVIAHCAERLGSFKKPQKVFFADSKEQKISGKLSRKDLKAMLDALMKQNEDEVVCCQDQ